MRAGRQLRREPPVARNVVFLVLIVAIVALAIGAVLVFGAFLERFGV